METKDIEEKKCNWAEEEFRGVDFGDVRLKKRVILLADSLSNYPLSPINQASEDSASTKAAYRFFGNGKVDSSKIMSGHIRQTVSRAREESVILAIQDTSYLNYSKHKKTTGLGSIGSEGVDGLIMHSTLACTTQGLPLGLLTHKCWGRDGLISDKMSRKEADSRPFCKKESYKWFDSVNEISKLNLGIEKVVHIADRESDIYEFLRESHRINAHYVIRANHDRKVILDTSCTINEAIESSPVRAILETKVPNNKAPVILECRFIKTAISEPLRIKSCEREPLESWIIRITQTNAKAGEEPLEWTLLTNIPIKTIEDAIEKIQWYKLRWRIEEFHKILKSGCKIEECRLQSAEKLKRFIALFSIIAWRIFWMTHLGRINPQADATVILTKNEIQTLRTLKKFKDKLVKVKKLTVKKAITFIAMLGGYLNRKNDPPPGNTVLWRGWQRLSAMTEMYESMI
ncbi:MAG: IS4 family transposase [Merismopedia sp. SIO2A8]|nr:IS4 family transposase [Symploca sp. SIO2B6]NET48208.1 IS4 family transposase [Merismopedia sp. SIO2A8]